jgi:hypothetical protein
MAEWKDKVDLLSGRILEPEAPPLSRGEARRAAEEISKPLWKAVCRAKQDKTPAGQEFGLFSFTPARGVQPNEYGIYGTAKLRGNFSTEEAAAEDAERIIRYVDSVNEIYTVRVGQDFPLTKEAKFTKDFDTIDLSDHVNEESGHYKKQKKRKAAEETKVIIDREQKLLAEHKQILDGTYKEDPLDIYIREKVKLSQLKWTLEDTLKKIKEQIEPAIERTRGELQKLDASDSELKTKYMDKYMSARREAGLPVEFKEETGTQMDFIKYLQDD